MSNTDLFSKQASLYSQFRPQYPDKIYNFLVNQCKERDFAWDCATGNGQAANDLSRYFSKVIATDISEKQIANAIQAANVEYRVLKAEDSLGLKDHSLDLITVAQAVHWFDLNIFYAEVKRLLKPQGIFATWAYSFHLPIQVEIDKYLNEFYFETLGPYWKDNNKLIWNNYKELSFPFEEIQTPQIKLKVTWSLHDLIGYFKTWSSTQLFIDKNNIDPTDELFNKISKHWGNPNEKKSLEWDLVFRVGRVG